MVRINKFGRNLKALIYCTPKVIPQLDIEEGELSDKHDIHVRIRDGKYIVSHINDTSGTQAAYRLHLSRYTEFLKRVGASRTGQNTSEVDDPSVYVFLQQEVENRRGKTDLITTLTDGLILWALNDTDPDADKLMHRDEVRNRILNTIPWSKQFINNTFNDRINELSKKSNATGREVRHYKKEDKFCLPFETRQLVSQENAEAENLRISVRNELINDCIQSSKLQIHQAEEIAKITLLTVERFFEHQGLLFSHSLLEDSNNLTGNVIDDRIRETIDQHGFNDVDEDTLCSEVRRLLGNAFYHGTERQRAFLYQLAHTYILLFVLKAEPKIIEFFQSMTGNFRLYVGSDILVRAFTERYLQPENQMTRNMLRLSRDCGANLILSEPVLEELSAHIHSTNREFQANFAAIEQFLEPDFSRHASKILIRAYFYAKHRKQVDSWKKYLGQFITFSKLNSPEGKEELRRYLLSEFRMTYTTRDELEKLVSSEQVKTLADKLEANKSTRALAVNDALLIHTIYAKRRERNEMNKIMNYGFLTWWLTEEVSVLIHTIDLVKFSGAKYIMRPEFLLNFFALSPSKAEVVNAYKSIFPTVMGIQMGHRISPNLFEKVLNKVNDWKSLEPSRRSALLGSLSDQLKSDKLKQYENKFDDMLNSIDALN